ETAAARWLIFSDSLGQGDEMARQLRERGHEVVTVVPAAGFARLDDHAFTIAPDDPKDYASMLEALGDAAPQIVAHLWSVSGSIQDDFDEAQRNGFHSLTCLAQALEKRHMTGAIQIGFVS